MKKIILSYLLFSFLACTPSKEEYVPSQCNSPAAGKFKLGIYEISWNEDINYKEAIAAIPEIPNFKKIASDNSLGIKNMVGLTTSQADKAVILQQVKETLDPSFNFSPIWTKHNSFNSSENTPSYVLYLLKDSSNNFIIRCNNIKGYKATVGMDGRDNILGIEMDESSSKKLTMITERAFNNGQQSLAFVYQGEALFCPSIKSPILGSKLELIFFDKEEVQEVMDLLR